MYLTSNYIEKSQNTRNHHIYENTIYTKTLYTRNYYIYEITIYTKILYTRNYYIYEITNTRNHLFDFVINIYMEINSSL